MSEGVGMARYVYVASSWRNPLQPQVCKLLASYGVDHYDFRNPAGGTGFSWKDVKAGATDRSVTGKGSDWEPAEDYLAMVHHPVATAGFESDFNAMKRADTFVLVLPCGKSAHLELGWAVGAGKRTAILLEDPCEPELMYRMVDYLAPSIPDLLAWLFEGHGCAPARPERCPGCGSEAPHLYHSKDTAHPCTDPWHHPSASLAGLEWGDGDVVMDSQGVQRRWR